MNNTETFGCHFLAIFSQNVLIVFQYIALAVDMIRFFNGYFIQSEIGDVKDYLWLVSASDNLPVQFESVNYTSMGMWRDSLRRIPPIGFFPVEIRGPGPC